jgi:hypothetical protein
MRLLCTTACFLFITACGDDDKPAADTSQPSDTSETSDSGEVAGPDTSEPDATADTSADTEPDTTADAEPDTSADAEPDTSADAEPDTSADAEPDTSGCEYFEEPRILQCGQAYAQVLYWLDFERPECTPYWTRGEARYDTVEELATAEGCDASCVYVATQGVDFIRCDGQGRSGFETFSADGEGCDDSLYRTEDGIFPDLCLWAVYACYCEQ